MEIGNLGEKNWTSKSYKALVEETFLPTSLIGLRNTSFMRK